MPNPNDEFPTANIVNQDNLDDPEFLRGQVFVLSLAVGYLLAQTPIPKDGRIAQPKGFLESCRRNVINSFDKSNSREAMAGAEATISQLEGWLIPDDK